MMGDIQLGANSCTRSPSQRTRYLRRLCELSDTMRPPWRGAVCPCTSLGSALTARKSRSRLSSPAVMFGLAVRSGPEITEAATKEDANHENRSHGPPVARVVSLRDRREPGADGHGDDELC